MTRSPEPGRVLVGTASWTDKTLIDCRRFYPPEMNTAEGRLGYYASRFSMVEVDATYYALPSPHNAELWVERTPPDFVFNVKAFRLFTGHYAAPAVLPAELRKALGAVTKPNLYDRDLNEEIRAELWRQFRLGLEPLRRAGKLGAVLFQFAPWMPYSRSGIAQVLRCAREMPGMQVAVEFRNKSWFEGKHREEVLALEREHGLAQVVVDEPQGFPSSIPAVWEVTCPALAILRLHGRNRASWAAKGLSAAERFAYLYPEAELSELAAPVRELARQGHRVHVVFNNCYQDYAQRNALAFAQLLD